jgi:hypothetical protein
VAKIYNHAYLEISVYGHVMSLLRQYAGKQGVHVDIGCGYGAIAERVRDDLGLTYLGFDASDDGMAALRQRGFATYVIDLHSVETAEKTIREAIDNRLVASLSMIDTLEHIVNPLEILAMLRRLSGEQYAPLVVSAPHVAHKDIAIKALLGRWDWTDAGLLDHTHVGFYTEPHLTRVAAQGGWRQVAAKDWLLERSDQNFPPDLTALQVDAPLGAFLHGLAGMANPNCLVNQFVRAYVPDPNTPVESLASRDLAPGPFLTVVIRTQGKRIFQLREALLSLGGQSVDDFNIVVVLHRCIDADGAAVRDLIGSFPESLSGKAQIIECLAPGRAAPLNAALEHLAGRYVAFLDDDDFVFGHWVETFQKVATDHPGQIVRAACVRQETSWRPGSALGAHPSPTSWFETPYPDRYDFVQHLYENHSPFMSLAYPVSAFRDLQLRFDESLNTAEDWDLTCRAAQLCGVASTPNVTSVYRWWRNVETSLTAHDQEEWSANRIKIVGKLNCSPMLMPAGAAASIVELQQRILTLRQREDAWRTNPTRQSVGLIAKNTLPHRAMQALLLVVSAVRHNGGVRGSWSKTRAIVRSEGLKGLRRRLPF